MIKDVRILLVEDNPGDARLIREMLRTDSPGMFTLTTCGTLQEGLKYAKDNTFDLILLDLSLPDSMGLDTLYRFRNAVEDVAIVILTGTHDITMIGVEALQRGAQDYLIKDGVDDKILRRSIRYAIERKRIENQLRRTREEYRSLIDDVFNTSMVAVLILDKEFKVVWCNEATKVYFGIEQERLIGQDKRLLVDEELKCIFADPDDYAARLLKAYEEVTFTDRFECQVLPDRDRDERWLEHWSQPIRDGMYAGGRIEQYTDITDRKKLEITEREQREFAEALRDISTVLTSSLDLDEVLRRILNNAGRAVPHDSALITLIEDGHVRIAQHQSTTARDTQEIVAEKRLHTAYKPYTDIMFDTGDPVVIDDLQADSRIHTAADANIHAYVGVPIQLQESIIGFINLLSEEVGYFNYDHAERLQAFSQLAAIAIQNARLYDQSRQLATLEARQRLARELHDSVSQTLFTCRTLSETALRRWNKDPEQAYELMNDVNQMLKTTLAEMRILLLELRPSALKNVDVKQLFEQYLQPIQDRREFELELQIDDISPLPEDVRFALYRITQEALNNVNKHAQAQRVSVYIGEKQDTINLEIFDDGRGFKHDEIAATSLGLSIMRERAQEIGASIDIVSEVGQGTQIKVIWIRNKTT